MFFCYMLLTRKCEHKMILEEHSINNGCLPHQSTLLSYIYFPYLKQEKLVLKISLQQGRHRIFHYIHSLSLPLVSYRSDREFLYQILGEVIKAGATTLNIPDTVGYTLPTEFGQLIADLKVNTPGIENIIISTHCQNDLGLSTANTLAVGISFCCVPSFLHNPLQLVLTLELIFLRGHVLVQGK